MTRSTLGAAAAAIVMFASCAQADTAHDKREKIFKADHEVLIREHQLEVEFKAKKITKEQYETGKKDVQARAAKVRAEEK